ncbi:LytR/AlgR family response regulator transcription factor [Heyndrickxia ginsengihumi]|uniref:LytR/AlgR family response regulator transcription factor n=1 Tax=Heyndrickxia ginsengihumi TaxID=363870 RepID=UPI000471F3EB|nr:LytTR family DNA-binding domain-containing protein [Heyndrickxia ginsengihumi]
MQPLKIVIADDDASARATLKHFIDLCNGYDLIGEVDSREKFIEAIIKEKPNIALVELNILGINGMEAIKSCKDIHPSLQIIFITENDQFAVEAFNISAVDYILKPIERTRFYMALEKARKSLNIFNMMNDYRVNEKTIVVKSYNRLLFLSVNDILFVEKQARKTVFHTCNNQYETTKSLREIEKSLPGYFFKTHRSFLVNLHKVIRIESFGETYLAYFSQSTKVAHISKLKIREVQAYMSN